MQTIKNDCILTIDIHGKLYMTLESLRLQSDKASYSYFGPRNQRKRNNRS